MKLQRGCLFLIQVLIFIACDTSRKFSFPIPPGTMEVAVNLYCDGREISNLDWLEYLHWTEIVYGATSEEYHAAIPDSTVWWKSGENSNVEMTCLFDNTQYYFRNISNRDYPVVGITQQQAYNYSKWRSDRVFEYILIKMKKIKWDSMQTRETHFTIERYFDGTLNTIISEDKLQYYPEYRLPTLEERRKTLHYSDSLDKIYFNKNQVKHRRDKLNEYLEKYPEIHCNMNPCRQDSLQSNLFYNNSEIMPMRIAYEIPVASGFCNLRGNVSEWSAIPDITFGGGWYDSKERILENDLFTTYLSNVWTGFRNICQWKYKDDFNPNIWTDTRELQENGNSDIVK